MNAWSILTDVVFLLGACLVGGALFARFKQSPIAGYLIAGMLVGGPGSFQIVGSQTSIEAIAELGVALLLFGLGLEFSVAQLRTIGRNVMLGGVLQVGATLAVVAGGLFLLGTPGASALTIGAMLALSSTAIVLRTLVLRGELDSLHGRATVGVLLVQDVALVPLAVLVTSLGEGGDALSILLSVGKTLGLSVLFLLALYVVITHGVMRFLGRLGAERNREFSVILAVVVGLGSTALAHEVGLSPALGAFLAGMFLGSSHLALQLRADVASIRTVLLTLFFGAVGMVADPTWIVSNLGQVLLVATVVLTAKIVVAWLSLRAVGRSVREATAVSLCLAQVGEFAFVLGTIGLAYGTLSLDQHGLVVSVAIVSLLVAPYLIRFAPHAALWMAKRSKNWRPAETDDGGPDHEPNVVVIGFGLAGRESVRSLDVPARSVCVIDLNETSLMDARALGYETILGDATQEEVLVHAHVASARVVVITPPSRSMSLMLLDLVRSLAPTAVCVVRARHAQDVPLLAAAGAAHVASDESSVGGALRSLVVESLGVASAPLA